MDQNLCNLICLIKLQCLGNQLLSFIVLVTEKDNLEKTSLDLPEDLLNGCLSRNPVCQKQLYKRFYGFAMAICYRYAQNRDDAVAIMNVGFYKIFTQLEKYDAKKPFKPWFSRVITNTAIDHYRSSLRHAHHEDISEIDDVSIDPSVYSKLNYDELLKMVQTLPNGYRTVFNMYAIDGFTHEEISKKLGISVGTSKSNLFKARQKLKLLLTEENEQNRNIQNADNQEIENNEKNNPESYRSPFQRITGISRS